jgi:hypothetical protein
VKFQQFLKKLQKYANKSSENSESFPKLCFIKLHQRKQTINCCKLPMKNARTPPETSKNFIIPQSRHNAICSFACNDNRAEY